jgi:anaerobic selenocysteine-containing dehydrogenase
MVVTHPTFCRMCHDCCPILVDVEDGVPVTVRGDATNDVYNGYTCVKGRALPEQHTSPDRLLHSQKRSRDGSFSPISSEQAIDEIAARLQSIIERHGPLAIASYQGTFTYVHPASVPMLNAFNQAIGNPRSFGPISIDQPGKTIAQGLMGVWMGGGQNPAEADVALVIGSNPLVTITGGLPQANPRRHLRAMKQRGFKLIVVDPRRTETASQADIHLQVKPGEDVALVAGMIRLVLVEDLYDASFVAAETSGIHALRQAVEPFTPEEVARRADITVDDFVAATRCFAGAKTGNAVAGVGPNMSTARGTLFEYLVACLNALCGRLLRAGERQWNPGTVVEPPVRKAQAMPPFPAFGYDPPMRVRGLAGSLTGYQTSAIPDEILLPGEGQIRAVISVGGNPVVAWPDQLKVREAFEQVELLVQIDPWMSATAKMAHYVIAPKLSLEIPGMTNYIDMIPAYAPGYGIHKPWAQYSPAIVDPPPGSDLVAEWEFFYGLAQRMGLHLEARPVDFNGPTGRTYPIDMVNKPTDDELLELLTTNARIRLDEVKRHPHGAVFDDPSLVVGPKDGGWEGRLDLGNALLMDDLGEVASRADGDVASWADADHPFRLIGRRMHSRYNASGHTLEKLVRADPYNPAYLHPADLVGLGVRDGDVVEISSPRGTILGVVRGDDTIRRGLVAMAANWGDLPGNDLERGVGSSTGRLLDVDGAHDPYSGQPLMTNVPVAIRPFRGVPVG